MRKIILSTIFLAIAALTATAQDKLIHVADKSTSWRKGKPKTTLFYSEMARLLMPQGAAFGVECIPSFSPEWTLTYDSVARSLVYREAQTSIWHTTYQATHKKKKIGEKRYKWVPRKRPKGYVAPNVKTFTMAVSDDQSAMLRAVWKTAVYGAEEREVFILDGVKWEYFIDGRRAKSHRDKNVLVAFTEELRKAIRSGDTNRKDSLIGNEFQRVIDGLTIVPDSSYSGPNAIRLAGSDSTHRSDSVIVILNGVIQPDSISRELIIRPYSYNVNVHFYKQHQMIDSMMVYKDEDARKRFEAAYGFPPPRLGFIEITTIPDTLSEAYMRQHPEKMPNRRRIEGSVQSEEGKLLTDAWVSCDTWNMGTATDSTGHFVICVPRTVTKLYVRHVGYQTICHTMQPADTILNFRMKDATRIKEVKVIPKKDRSKIQRIRIR